MVFLFYLVFLFEMSVKCFDKSSFMITEVAFPWFVFAVVPVHVVHQSPEPLALVLQKGPSEANPKVRNHGEGPY